VNGSDREPIDPTEAADQMRDATDRLRDQAWMVAPFTSPVSDLTEVTDPVEAEQA
jgi:hypothetical protein